MAGASPGEVEGYIHSVGFFHTKARHLVETAAILAGRWKGEVPGSMDELLGLPGVGRKTANLVLSACHGQPGIIVDTHVLRVALRLGFAARRDPAAVEKAIAASMAPATWTTFSHALNRHGKHVCTARKPACLRDGPDCGKAACPLSLLCPRIGL